MAGSRRSRWVLLDTHVGADEVEQLCDPINLFDAAERQKVLDDQGRSTEAKADLIASATRHAIEHEMAKDPAFYKKFSKLLEDVLAVLHEKRMAALEAMEKLKDIATKVATHTDENVPSELQGNDMARRYFGCIRESVAAYSVGNQKPSSDIALRVVDRLAKHKIRDWRANHDAINKMRGEIDDILFEIAEQHGIEIPMEEHDAIIDRCIEVAIANED